jgi:hypothetical protein
MMNRTKHYQWPLLTLAMATSAVLTTTACSDSDLNEVVPETPQEVANAYFQMTVDVSSTSSDTRATL